MSFLELAERCEQAAGPCWQLDLDISEATKAWVRLPTWDQWKPTASLDAAMTLVPEGWCRTLHDRQGHLDLNAKVSLWTPDEGVSAHCHAAKTLPLALCAAALRARATTQEQEP